MVAAKGNFSIKAIRILLICGMSVGCCHCATSSAATDGKDSKSGPPNIILVYADDVDCETVFGQFPQQETEGIQFANLKAMAEQGLRFSNFHVTTPVCGPSRACLYTGQYAHRNGCRVNDPNSIRASGFNGGFKTFNPRHELSLWMKKAGYMTAHVGKYLHSDFKPDHKNGIYWRDIIPPGWDHFRLSLGSQYLQFPSYVKSTDRFTQTSGDEYRTDWDIRNAIGVLQSHANGEDRNKPLMLCWSPIAAHVTGNGSPMVAPRHKSLYSDAEIPDFMNRLNEPAKNQIEEMRKLDVPAIAQRDYMNDIYRDRLRATQSIDEGIGALRMELDRLGMLDNTIFVVTSDHGFRFAHHRHYGKRLPYDRITRVPFIVTGPGVPKNSECKKLLANIDIAPTLLAIAGSKTPESCDGKSFAGLISNPDSEPSFDRDAILIENWGQAVSFRHVIPATYSSMRMQDSVYTEWASGGREFFDLQADPAQNHNLYPELEPERQKQLAAGLRKLRKSNLRPRFAECHYEREIDSTRICASLRPVKLFGSVESDSGTKKVELEFYCKKTGKYWSENGWFKRRHRFAADLKQPGGLTSQWSFELDSRSYSSTKNANLGACHVDVSLVATDHKNRQTREKALAFTLAFADPDTTIDTTELNDQKKKTLTVSGQASDLESVHSVKVGFQNPVTRKYWDGKTWHNEFCHLDADLNASDSDSDSTQSNWTVNVPVPEATPRLIVIARAYNPNTLFDHSPAMKSVVVETGE